MKKLFLLLALIVSLGVTACQSDEEQATEEQEQKEEIRDDRDSLLDAAGQLGDDTAQQSTPADTAK